MEGNTKKSSTNQWFFSRKIVTTRAWPPPSSGSSHAVPRASGGVPAAVRARCGYWGLFRRPFHPEPIRGNGNASEPTRHHLQLLSR